jgi:hypothetical protein
MRKNFFLHSYNKTKHISKKKELFVKERTYEWLVISKSYFQCALMNARILREQLSNFAITEDSPLDFFLKKIYGNYPQSCEYLIFPIIFNFKHGIEIYLKSIVGIRNSKFYKNHDLFNLLKDADIKDEKIKYVIKKYARSHLFLPCNKKNDIQNEFERYPQGSPYDDLSLFPPINKFGKIEDALEIKSIVTQEKIDELIEDIEFLYCSFDSWKLLA